MDYLFENLDEHRFQQFCQAILAREYPDLQCYPIGQPDGGRDAISYLNNNKKSGFIVFQVKYVRKPLAVDDPHKWITNVVKGEIDKISNLITRGAQKYILITNVPGTSHLDVGSIDKVQQIFSDNIMIPAYCWWRDDISRKLDSAAEIKWAYSEILSGKDILQHLVNAGLKNDNDRRTRAIKGYIRKQYGDDQDVRFKEVELRNNLLDLFVDVPISKRDLSRGLLEQQDLQIPFDKVTLSQLPDFFVADSELSDDITKRYLKHLRHSLPSHAASLLLLLSTNNNVPNIVLEGAPGQGKSTITQYICQVHRMKILDEKGSLRRLPDIHRSSSVRFPLKAELRDFAVWLGRQNPFDPRNRDDLPANWLPSLEAFLAAQISYLSGGIDFSVNDLHAVAELSSILLVMDGLDEVADIELRRALVEKVEEGIGRLRDSAASLQVIITSRPAAFANSPGFSEAYFPHFELASLTRELIDEYAEKWIKVRQLREYEKLEIRKVLAEKLDQPHLKDLARNPMQLAILLRLIYKHGASLPDQRTALYDSYINLFFDREVDKSPIVRENRNRLMDIHRYIAWLLHSEAELRGNGTIGEDRLKEVIQVYIEEQGYDSNLTTHLFTGTVERIGALVSRVQGYFEFEVQPLREYFVSRYLYETAPYSPPGMEVSGTKPDRFQAISRNFYWLNVTRFFAGCFSKGELVVLIDLLQELFEEVGYNYISHPRTLAVMLLADGVFTQHPKSMKNMINYLLSDLRFRYVLPKKSGQLRNDLSLTFVREDVDATDIYNYCFNALKQFPVDEISIQIIEFVKQNANHSVLKDFWLSNIQYIKEENITKWIEYGLYLEILPLLSLADLSSVLSQEFDFIDRLSIFFKAGNSDLYINNEVWCDVLVDAILDRKIVRLARADHFIKSTKARSVIEAFYNDLRLMEIYSSSRTTIFSTLAGKRVFFDNEFSFFSESLREITSHPSFNVLNKCSEFAGYFQSHFLNPDQTLSERVRIIGEGLEILRSAWGERWLFFHIAGRMRAGDAKKTDFHYAEYNNLFDNSAPLWYRTLYATSKPSSAKWWKKQFAAVSDTLSAKIVCLFFLNMAHSNLKISLAKELDSLLVELHETDWHQLFASLRKRMPVSQELIREKKLPNNDLNLGLISTRTAAALGVDLGFSLSSDLFDQYLVDYEGEDQCVWEFMQKIALSRFLLYPESLGQNLHILRKSYRSNIEFPQVLKADLAKQIPLEVAEEIVTNVWLYPLDLVELAEIRCRQNIKISSVSVIAQEEKWF